MANNLLTDPALVRISNTALVEAQKDIAFIKAFSHSFDDDFQEAGGTVKVALYGATAGTFDLSTNNYSNSTGTVSYVDVKLDQQPLATFKYSGMDELNKAVRQDEMGVAAGQAVAGSIVDTFEGAFTSAALTAEYAIGSTLTKGNLAKARNACKDKIRNCVLVLTPQSFTEAISLYDSNVIASTDPIRNGTFGGGLYGFSEVLWADFPSVGKDFYGYVIPKNAIAFAAAAVKTSDDAPYASKGVQTDENGFPITIQKWGDMATGCGVINCTTLWGMKLITPDNIVRLVKA